MNTLALNVDYVLRTGPFHIGKKTNEIDNPVEFAKNQYESVGEEILVSGSDDFTLFLWKPEKEKKSVGKYYMYKHDVYRKIEEINCVNFN